MSTPHGELFEPSRGRPEPEAPRVPWQRLLSRPTQFVLDLTVLVLAFMLAYALRFEFVLDEATLHRMLVQLPMVVLLQFGLMHVTGIYTFVWRYVGMAELRAFIAAAWWSFLPLLVLRLGLPDGFAQWRVPLSICLMTSVFGIGGVLFLRVLRRGIYERFEKEKRTRNANGVAKPVLLVGAGRAGVLAAREIQSRGDVGLEIRGFVDDAPEKQGSVIQGVKVIGTASDLPRLVPELGIDHVVITVAQASREQIRRLVEICESIPVKARIIPGLYEILGGTVEISRIRDVQIEDLLGRQVVHLDEDVLRGFLEGRTVMVTGAGGSIGSELCRQAARFGAGRLLLVERAEFALFDVDRELRTDWPETEFVPLVADISDERRMRRIFEHHDPEVVVHAAAHKHVPLMETNVAEAVKNNVLGTRLVGELSCEHGARAFLQISTDKAVRPTSVMGASKRLAELVTQDLNRRGTTRCVSVRFGNVLGSAGSVIPIFRQQILNGGPVTVTHPDMVRYFMTIPEAAQLVLEAGAIGDGGEIFILDMGEPVRILDMAKDMISLFGLRPYADVEIVFTGVRPGEKLFEELQTAGESVARTRHPKILVGRIQPHDTAEIEALLQRLAELAHRGEDDGLRSFLGQVLPEARLDPGGGAEAPQEG